MSQFWDEKFSRDGFTYGTRPNQFLASKAELFAAGGAALVPGDGEGRNGVWLAEQGLAVTSVDSSPVGQGKARLLAERRGVAVDFQLVDLLSWQWPAGRFDFVVSIFFHLYSKDRPRLHAAMLDALKPGGWLVLEAFRPEQLGLASGGPKELDLLYGADLLAKDFAGAEIVELADVECVLDEGPLHQGLARTTRLLARKS
jgi:SAM-dependent methyltransferase